MYDDSNIITHTFFTEVNKKIQSYGLISLEDDLNYKNIINSKNKLKLNIINDIQKEFIMLPLEDILNPKKLKQSIKNNKIFNLINWKSKRNANANNR